MHFDLPSHTHLLTVCGSRAYGMHTSESDVDVKGVCVPPLETYFGFLRSFDQADKPEHLKPFIPLLSEDLQGVVANSKLEGSVYHLTKFIKLASDCMSNCSILAGVFLKLHAR
jgi:predicted nucleotidyltransferase